MIAEKSNRKCGITSRNIPVPKKLDEAVKEAANNSLESKRSDFVRNAVKCKLEEMGFSFVFWEM